MSSKRHSTDIIEEIKRLLDELAISIGSPQKQVGDKKSPSKLVKSFSNTKGALGAIGILVEEGFFNTPREVSAVMERLKEIGHYHKRNAVSMNLLNMTKRRELNRFKNKETKNWEYVIRR